MATDATGTPTSKGIPKYNPSVDAPSGLGFNAAMDAIDTLLDSYVPKPASIATGEVPVWNGSAFARSSVTRIGASSLGSGTPDSTTYLRGDSSWATIAGLPAGVIMPYAGLTVPTGYLACDGSSVSRTTYADLWAALNTSKGTFTVTIASPGVFTLTNHGLQVGDAVYFTTTGALPTGLSANTTYYVSVRTDANTFQVSATYGGSSVNTSGSQSGTHTLIHAPYGIPAGSTTNFLVPDLQGRVAVGKGTNADTNALGDNENRTEANRTPRHAHSARGVEGASSGANSLSWAFQNSAPGTIYINGTAAISTTAPTTVPVDMPAYLTTQYIIKT